MRTVAALPGFQLLQHMKTPPAHAQNTRRAAALAACCNLAPRRLCAAISPRSRCLPALLTTRVIAVMVRATPPMKPASPASWATSMGSALVTVEAARLAGAALRAALRTESNSIGQVSNRERGEDNQAQPRERTGMGGIQSQRPTLAH